LFLRNHDELTLEMVTDEERDYMYLAYSADPRMRINVGIRRRLAPLVDNSRRRIELLNSLLFSFPGTPIVYYGDEIGMGDNIYLGDRNGVRTPMQWSGDRNAGFSRAVPAKLYSPVVMDPVWGYEAINVEAQQSDPSSLLSWMRNMIALRKLFQVFGRGTLTFLNPANRKILAYIREFQNERVLCVANLSRFAQPVELDLAQYAGMVPVEMLGYVEFPRIRTSGYPLTLGPYGFLWLELQPSPEPGPAQHDDGEPKLELNATNDWMSVLEGRGRRELEETILQAYIVRQRWFGGKSRVITGLKIEDWAVFNNGTSALAFVGIQYGEGENDTYLVTLGLLFGRAADALREESPNALLARVVTPSEDGVLHEAIFNDSASEALLGMIPGHAELPTRDGVIKGVPSTTLPQLQGPTRDTPRRGSAEQSNTSIIFGDRLIMKLFRRQQFGPNPDTEIGSYLTESAHFTHIAPFGGSIQYQRKGQEPSTLAMLQGLVSNEGDGWGWTLEELDRYFEASAAKSFAADGLSTSQPSLLQLSQAQETPYTREHVGPYLDAAALLGKRTAELHLALARSTTDAAFSPEPLSVKDIDTLRIDLLQHAAAAFDALKANVAKLPDTVLERAGLVMSRRTIVLDRLRQLATQPTDALRTRIHGDYHLGQVLRSKGDFVILDFEGEPARSLAERRTKQSPMKDVAGMLRSFSYAAFSALIKYSSRRPEDFHRLEPWAKLWEQSVSSAFLRTYCESVRGVPVISSDPNQFAQLLEAFVIDKALYELTYELNNRPNWVVIPLTGILAL
jgi:maltose alpha-D-glucosyltransferase/alpha-amylase